ncbi:MAG TPA: beta-L-arabinofuranosidase domain-containing protein, partial [Woeseiaceae bacterium]|nr:beta-L-arabinofuranosidase domain-containing protein [Woeseiaceae bacterium]
MLALVVLAACTSGDRQSDPAPGVSLFALTDVRLLDGSPFKAAEATNLRYVLAFEPDRLLAPYLREAGLEPKNESYGNWENTGLDGHIGGHYLSALSLAYAATGDAEVLARLNYMLDELERAQGANGDGYLGGIPGGRDAWRAIARGDIDAEPFSLNGKWVPWYNLDKTFAGLRDAWTYTGSEQAKRMLVALTDWAEDLVAGLSDEQVEAMLQAEHGGLNAVFADVAEITGDPRYLDLARRFSHRQLLDPLLAGEDRLDGLHANTQIPKVVGYQRVAWLIGDAGWAGAAERFWRNVVHERTVAIGGNSVR